MKTEKDLDNLFKQGLEGPGNYKDYRDGDWDNLEAMLDKRKRRDVVAFWLPVVTGMAALLLMVFGWFFISPPARNKNDNKPVVIAVNSLQKNQPKHNLVKADHNNMVAVVQPVKGNTGAGRQVTRQQVHHATHKGLGVRQSFVARAQKSKPYLTVPADETGHNTTGVIANNLVTSTTVEMLNAVNKQVFSPATLNTAVAFNELNIKPMQNDVPVIKKRLTGFNPRMAVTVLASSNLNGVKTFSGSEVGTNAGLLFSVGVSKRLTISTGAIYAKTPYSTAFSNYHSAYNFKIAPESVSADCRVLDIPLNIDYQLFAKAKNSLSIGTGLSSYIMLRENYHYNYAGAYTYGGPVDISIVNRNQHVFGVLNLDATYQRQLNSKLGIALQPYLKLPLTDIGNGQVNLRSTGVSVGLSWNINSLSKH
jgi:hypothetical protein